MRRAIEQTAIRLEGRLRPVAMMDIEIDNRNSGEPVHFARPQRPDCRVVEKAKTHRSPRLGMMTRRADCAECIVGFL